VSKDYDFETATESERWAYDQGHEDGWNGRLKPEEMGIGDVREVMEIVLAALTRLANEQAERKQKAAGTAWDRHDDIEQQP